MNAIMKEGRNAKVLLLVLSLLISFSGLSVIAKSLMTDASPTIGITLIVIGLILLSIGLFMKSEDRKTEAK
jgi:predicted membrane channel-forming protein YqfA (hemolysin III family)